MPHCGLQSNNVAKLCIAWRKALRRIWNVSPRMHCDVICLLSESIPLEICMKQRFLKFIYKAFEHSSPPICSVAKLLVVDRITARLFMNVLLIYFEMILTFWSITCAIDGGIMYRLK